MIAWEFWVGLGLGLALSGGAFALLWWNFRRTLLRLEVTRAKKASDPPPSATASVPANDLAPDRSETGSARETPAAVSVPSVDRRSGGSDLPAYAPISALASAESDDEPVRLSQQVLLHLARQGSFTAAGTANEASTQKGMGVELGATQGALSNVLRRLEDGGAIVSEKNHVHGRDRRVKTYVLTLRGRELAAALQRRSSLERVAPGGSPATGTPRAPPTR